MQARKYYFRSTAGGLLGPFSFNQVAEMVQAGTLKAMTPVSTDGKTFRVMKALPELATLLSVDIDMLPHTKEKEEVQVDTPPTYSGDLQQLSILKVIYHFFASQSTGRLQFLDGETIKDVFLSNGKPVHVLSNRSEEQFSQYLLQQRLIEPGQLEAIMQMIGRDEQRFPDVLLKQQFLSPEDLFSHLKAWVLTLLYDLFAWREGHYLFFEGQEYQRAPLPLSLSSWEVIAEGVRRGYEEAELKAILLPFLNRSLFSKDNTRLHLTELGLTPVEAKVFKAIEGGLSLGVVLDQLVSAGSKTVLSMVYLGIELDLVGIGGEITPPDSVNLNSVANSQWDHSVRDAEPTVSTNIGPFATNAPLSPEEKRLLEVLNQTKEKNFFERLRVEPTTPREEITKAFVKAAREFHPDQTQPNSTEQIVRLRSEIFALLNEAHQTLSDETRRADYLANQNAGLAQGDVDVSAIMRSEVLFQKGQALLRSSRFAEARSVFEEAISLNPEEGEFLIYRAFAEFSTQPNDQAVRARCSEEIQRGLKLRNYNVAQGFVFLGRIAKAGGDLAAAERHFKKALSLEKDHIEATRELRLMSMRSGKKGQPRS